MAIIAEIVRDWHPLDGGPAPDYIPQAWDGPHVGKRLVEALRTLTNLSIPGASASCGSAWPAYQLQVEFSDLLAMVQADATQQKQDAETKNWTRPIPSASEIARMESAITWPASYLLPYPQFLRAVSQSAHARARNRSLHWAARRLRLPPRLLRRWNRDGLDLIAVGLRTDAVRIF